MCVTTSASFGNVHRSVFIAPILVANHFGVYHYMNHVVHRSGFNYMYRAGTSFACCPIVKSEAYARL